MRCEVAHKMALSAARRRAVELSMSALEAIVLADPILVDIKSELENVCFRGARSHPPGCFFDWTHDSLGALAGP